MEQHILSFLKNNSPALCVMATASDKPECAVLAYVVLNDLTILLSTHTTSRKWKNIQSNNKVALTFGWNFTSLNVQLDGVAELIDQNHKDFAATESIYFTAHPEVKQFKGPETAFIKVSPTWARTTDFSVHPMKVEEKDLI